MLSIYLTATLRNTILLLQKERITNDVDLYKSQGIVTKLSFAGLSGLVISIV